MGWRRPASSNPSGAAGQKMTGSPTGAPKLVSRKSKSQPSWAWRDVPREHPAIAAFVARRGRRPGGAAAASSSSDTSMLMLRASTSRLDAVAGAHAAPAARRRGFRRDMQDAGAVAGAAHPRVGNPQHVAHTLFQQLLRDRQHPPFRHARTALRAGVLEDQDMVGRHVEIVASSIARHHGWIIVEDQRRPAMLQEARIAAPA